MEGFKKDVVNDSSRILEEALSKHVREELFPEMCEFIQREIYKASIDGKKEYKINTRVPHEQYDKDRNWVYPRRTNILGGHTMRNELGVPDRIDCEIGGVKGCYAVPRKMRLKYQDIALQLFILEYQNHEKDNDLVEAVFKIEPKEQVCWCCDVFVSEHSEDCGCYKEENFEDCVEFTFTFKW